MDVTYERVSTIKQDERRQEIALSHIKVDRRYIDKVTGKNAERPQLNKMKLQLKEGDNIYVESISRFGRNVDDLREITQYFKEKGVVIHFIKEGFNTNGDTYKFLLTILGAVAEMERELIVERVKRGNGAWQKNMEQKAVKKLAGQIELSQKILRNIIPVGHQRTLQL